MKLKIKNSKFFELPLLPSNSNWTISGKAGTGMSLLTAEVLKQYRVNGGVKFVFDVGPTFKRVVEVVDEHPLKTKFDPNPFNNITQKMAEDYLANCTTHIPIRSN